jgi:endo-1,4-beta-D-glucanase Y
MSRRLSRRGGLLAAVVALGGIAATTSLSLPGTKAPDPAITAAQGWLRAYVAADGRVVRRDQGGDTVSEGQGYGLLLAVAVDDRRAFSSIWSWTEQHLLEPDGLLAWRYDDGRVVSSTPAADGDLDTAWALTLAAHRFGDAAYADAARRIARAIATLEVGRSANGLTFLAAGPFGVGRAGERALAAPGYWAPPAYRALAGLGVDRSTWVALLSSMPALLGALAGRGGLLPPGWITFSATGTPVPTTVPGDSIVRCGPNAQRTLVWAALDPTLRPVEDRWWADLSATATAAPLARSRRGAILAADRVPLGAVSAAASAVASGHPAIARSLLDEADRLAERYPTYYGDAWDALGRLLLTTGTLGAAALPDPAAR